jgi:DNA excision repair protein ERCC-4
MKIEAAPFKPLPPPPQLSGSADFRPVVIIDTREQTPLAFQNLPAERGTLTTGDYSFRGGEDLFAVERKSVADLIACCCGENRQRFERELHRLRGFRFARLLIVGSEAEITAHRYRGNMNPKAVLHTVRAFEARYVPVVWEPSEGRAAEMVERWVYWFAREVVTAARSVV